MQEQYFKNNGYTFKRVDKKTARRAVANGLIVIVCPVNLEPFKYYTFLDYNPTSKIFGGLDYTPEVFKNFIDSFEYFKCINEETGRYAAFYIPVKLVNTWDTREIYDYTFLNQ